jgi:hypothetical protein
MQFRYDLDEIPLRTEGEYTGVPFSGRAEIEIVGNGTWWVRSIEWRGSNMTDKRKWISLDPADPIYTWVVQELEDNYGDHIRDSARELA